VNAGLTIEVAFARSNLFDFITISISLQIPQFDSIRSTTGYLINMNLGLAVKVSE
jgi:hypothetical protein